MEISSNCISAIDPFRRPLAQFVCPNIYFLIDEALRSIARQLPLPALPRRYKMTYSSAQSSSPSPH